jgi:hypothetical protein
MRFFSIFEVRGGNIFFKFTFSNKRSELSKELKLIFMWPKHTNILFIFCFLFFRYSNMITFFADDIQTHEIFFNFTKEFFFIQTGQISLRFDLFNAHRKKIMPNSRTQRKLSVLQ